MSCSPCHDVRSVLLQHGPGRVMVHVAGGERIVTHNGVEISREPAGRGPTIPAAPASATVRSGVVHRAAGAPPLPPCAFLGRRVGEVKVVCSQPATAMHECLHPEREARPTRGGQLRAPRALPATDCSGMNGKTYQGCATCDFWQERKLLSFAAPSPAPSAAP